MFGKKKEPEKAASPTSFQLQILTTEYLIEGTAKGELKFVLPLDVEYWNPIVLTSAKITAVREDSIPVRTVDQFEVKGNAVVAMVPRKDATTMSHFSMYQDSGLNVPLSGVFHVGPYLFEGTLMIGDDRRFSDALVMVDVTIRYPSAKSQLAEIRAPHVLVNAHWMQGREVR